MGTAAGIKRFIKPKSPSADQEDMSRIGKNFK